MMSNGYAIQILKSMRMADLATYEKDALETAIYNIELNTPKSVDFEAEYDDGEGGYGRAIYRGCYCPNCGEIVEEDMKRCPECGQALRWDDEE